MSGYIVYEGPSMLDKKPIVAILTLNSTNTKTGNMAQLWILRSDIEPHLAVKTGEDQSVCGGCKHRHYNDGACYVIPFQGPLQVYRSYKKGNYAKLYLSVLADLLVRIGAYGDPLMLPEQVIRLLVESSLGTTAYSHQWKNKRLSAGLDHCQGSVDSLEEAKAFKELYPNGKYFRVTNDISDIQPNELICPADTSDTQCKDCMMCDGKTQDIVIEVHGSFSKRFKKDKLIDIKEVI